MPYRRLPNTDKSRLRSLEKAIKRFEKDDPSSLPFSEASLSSIRVFYPNFHNAMLNLDAAKSNQVDKNKNYIEICRKARMYLSHYIHVMNFAINRGELKYTIRTYYKLETFENSLPPFSTDTDLLKWGKIIIEGDQKRIMAGGSPIYNPSIALVKVNFEKFTEVYHFQKTLQATSDRLSLNVINLREQADQLILQIWNEIEKFFDELPDSIKRQKSEKYGVVYVYRKTELEKIEASKLQSKLML